MPGESVRSSHNNAGAEFRLIVHARDAMDHAESFYACLRGWIRPEGENTALMEYSPNFEMSQLFCVIAGSRYCVEHATVI
ncbi:hypothetical protein CEXT_477711 [Caerostris extrusa]|uniref:Uncharacterized protein n=1 Tax=Caerostris extrusa TaxID=172846 RepID=A0AAV4Q5R5_CAEEX|nr:hypothetical protein CEXT_477711 [Caerostris extrusa]